MLCEQHQTSMDRSTGKVGQNHWQSGMQDHVDSAERAQCKPFCAIVLALLVLAEMHCSARKGSLLLRAPGLIAGTKTSKHRQTYQIWGGDAKGDGSCGQAHSGQDGNGGPPKLLLCVPRTVLPPQCPKVCVKLQHKHKSALRQAEQGPTGREDDQFEAAGI